MSSRGPRHCKTCGRGEPRGFDGYELPLILVAVPAMFLFAHLVDCLTAGRWLSF